MAGRLPMGQKELLRGKLMVKRGELTIKSAVKELKISYRQGRRIFAAYEDGGDAAWYTGISGSRQNGG